MSSRKAVRKKVIYKQARFHGGEKQGTLKTKLGDALELLKTCGDRRFNIGTKSEPCFLMNAPVKEAKQGGFICGTLITFTPGKDPLFIIDDEDASEPLIEKIQADLTDKGKRREFLESIIYFAVKGNHVALLQSQTMKAQHLENYFNWILNKSGVNSAEQRVILNDTPPPKIAEKIRMGCGVREINLMGSITANEIDQNSYGSTMELFDTNIEEKGVSKFFKWIVNESTDSTIDFDKLKTSEIQMNINLKYSDSSNDGGQHLMDTIGAVFRNVEDIDVMLELKNGSKIYKSDIKVHGPVYIGSYGGQLSEFEAYGALREWLLKTLSDKLN